MRPLKRKHDARDIRYHYYWWRSCRHLCFPRPHEDVYLEWGNSRGQLVLTHEIANYPGVESTSGFQLGNIMKKQVLTFGCKIRSNIQVTAFEYSANPKMVEINGNEQFFGRTVILSPGGAPRVIHVPGEAEFKGRGVPLLLQTARLQPWVPLSIYGQINRLHVSDRMRMFQIKRVATMIFFLALAALYFYSLIS